ncbi:N6-adenosine-methyltransferase catalytic subunit [Galendromus occidentalis]|uniref:mRNA m(6)A methyltransferase n=1 Tax=Galendromus occidentalis TaxID=34638 RepID=A0AAJ7WJ30_9ACAR|nr:N6-adenosine-methyltransferase catalytic subunit [Galendromus occidentalis]
MDSNDPWKDIQELKSRQSSFRERLLKRKKEREEIVYGESDPSYRSTGISCNDKTSAKDEKRLLASPKDDSEDSADCADLEPATESEIEMKIILCLLDVALDLPVDSRTLVKHVSKSLDDTKHVSQQTVDDFLKKFAAQAFISIKENKDSEGKGTISITTAEHTKLHAFSLTLRDRAEPFDTCAPPKLAKLAEDEAPHDQDVHGDQNDNQVVAKAPVKPKDSASPKKTDDLIENLLNLPSIREKENKKVGEEILDLLSKPTAKERSLVEKFKSQGGASVQEYCPHGTAAECKRHGETDACGRLHFKKILQRHTDESLGDCSFLNTCFHMDTCKYVHYQVEMSESATSSLGVVAQSSEPAAELENPVAILQPAQWIQCDLRFFDMSILGKFSVIMADPPWDIHMELPYGTMSDDEMRQLNIPCLQDEGLIFLWVTGRAMELGRECLKLWGYERCDEIIWVKTNQLQRIIRTGRTGHWLNHGKEHCLVGMKGSLPHINRWLDCDVIVAEVRATSHKPDEIYGMIERLSPGTQKIELFGRPHNIQPNWMTLGNQLDGVRLNDQDIIENFRRRYPDGNCMQKP